MSSAALRTWWAAAGALLVTLVLAVAPANAHAELIESDPADGATLTAVPEQVSFTFGEDLLDQGNAVVATRVSDGSRIELGAIEVSGPSVVAAWPPGSGPGQYRAAYRVVSADGHPIEGSIIFTVAGVETTADPSAPGPTAEGVGASSAADVDAADAGSSGPGAVLWVGLAAVVLVGIGLAVLRRRRG